MIINVDASVHLERRAWFRVSFLYTGCVVLVTLTMFLVWNPVTCEHEEAIFMMCTHIT